jgi:hypothetical protein
MAAEETKIPHFQAQHAKLRAENGVSQTNAASIAGLSAA